MTKITTDALAAQTAAISNHAQVIGLKGTLAALEASRDNPATTPEQHGKLQQQIDSVRSQLEALDKQAPGLDRKAKEATSKAVTAAQGRLSNDVKHLDTAGTVNDTFELGQLTSGAAKLGTLSAQASVDKAAVVKSKVDDYFARSTATYKLPDGTFAEAAPAFRMNEHDRATNTDSAQVFADALSKKLKPTDKATDAAIQKVSYGRGTPEQVALLTQKLIDKGEFKATKDQLMAGGETEYKAHFPMAKWPPTDTDVIKIMQGRNQVGIDCAGYVQQEFLAAHGVSRSDVGFQSVGNENLASLTGNKHFDKLANGKGGAGDLMILDKPPDDTVGHTVMIQDRHELTAAERASMPDINAFAPAGHKVQVYTVEASFGGHGRVENDYGGINVDPNFGGVQRRTFLFDETTGKWADMRPATDGSWRVAPSNNTGPYNHPMNGIYHPNGK